MYSEIEQFSWADWQNTRVSPTFEVESKEREHVLKLQKGAAKTGLSRLMN